MKLKNLLLTNTEDIKVDHLVRANRRSVSLEIRGDGELIVRAPLRMDHYSILDIVRKKARWIRKKQEQMKAREIPDTTKKYFLGRKLDVITIPGENASISFDENNFFITVPQHRTVRALLARWYKRKTLEIVIPRAVQLAKDFNLNVAKISISTAHRRWGSCNKKGHITFSFRLIMLPMMIVDYIIIHELAHLVELNHSKQFWTTVQKMMPEYEQHEKWLKHNGYRFNL